MTIPMRPAKTTKPSAISTTGCKIADSVGAILKQARLELGVNREDTAAKLKIPKNYIARFEDGVFDKLPDDVYTKIYLKAYCKFLGLDTQTMVNLHRQERQRSQALRARRQDEEHRHPTTAIPRRHLVVTPQIIRAAVLAAVVIGLAAYFWWAVARIVRPPAITVTSPRDGLVTTEQAVTIEGRTEQEVALRINGKYVAPDSSGNFKDTLELQEGLNEIKIVGMKKHSREAVLPLRIIVKPKDRATAALPAPEVQP